MKKIIVSMAIIIAPILFAINGFCQTQAKNFKLLASDSMLLASNENNPAPDLPTAETAVVDNKLIRSFNKDYKNAEAVKWYKIQDGFVSYCRVNGCKNKVFYDQKGRWRGNIIYYNDKTMPRDLRASVRSIYYDYAITQVEEIHVGDKIVFQVHLEGEKDWKQLLIADGDITKVTDFQKSLPATNN